MTSPSVTPGRPDPRVTVFRRHQAELGEGVLWHEHRQSLLWVDIERHQLLETRLDEDGVRCHEVGQMIGAVVPAAEVQLLVVLHDGAYRFHPDTCTITPFARPAVFDRQRLRFNDAKCDPQGRLWAGTLALNGERDRAQLYCFDPDGGIRVMLEPVSLSNGLAWAPDGRTLYYIDTPTRQVQAFDFDPAGGALRARRIALDLAPQPGFPDGCTIDREGHLWIAHWGGGCVTCWDPVAARLLDTVFVPASQVTNCTFGGPALDQLFITTAATGLSPEQRAAEPDAGRLFRARVEARGLPANVFGLPSSPHRSQAPA